MEIKLKIDFWKFFNEFRNYHALPRYIQISRDAQATRLNP